MGISYILDPKKVGVIKKGGVESEQSRRKEHLENPAVIRLWKKKQGKKIASKPAQSILTVVKGKCDP